MKLIEKIFVDDLPVSFYDGIDFDVISNHPKDGSHGFIFCFIDNWVKEVKKYQRHNTIDSILDGKKFQKFNSEHLENSYVAIYQLEGTDTGVLFEIIKQKVINKSFPEHPWIPISGTHAGAWKIGKSKNSS